ERSQLRGLSRLAAVVIGVQVGQLIVGQHPTELLAADPDVALGVHGVMPLRGSVQQQHIARHLRKPVPHRINPQHTSRVHLLGLHPLRRGRRTVLTIKVTPNRRPPTRARPTLRAPPDSRRPRLVTIPRLPLSLSKPRRNNLRRSLPQPLPRRLSPTLG